MRRENGIAGDVQLGEHDRGADGRVTTSTGGLANPWCRVEEPFRTSFRGLGTYIVPKVDVNLSLTWRSDPGADLAANYVVTIAIAQPSLGRPLSSGTVTVNLVEPGTLYGARQNNLDMRIAKIFRIRGTRAQFGVDLYNLLNTDVVTMYNEGYAAPTATSGSIGSRRTRFSLHATRGSTCSSISDDLRGGSDAP